MAILQSCCFWKDVHKGSYATAIYTLIYFTFCSFVMVLYIQDEQEFLQGKRQHPVGESILARGTVTPATVSFNILSLVCSVSLVVSSVLALVALKQNRPYLLIPWMAFMMGDILLELSHVIYLMVSQKVVFDPVVGFLFTMDFFIMSLNLYCLLCIVSQYQEYQEERRRNLQDRTTYVQPLSVKLDVSTGPGETNSQGLQATRHNSKALMPDPTVGSPFISSFQLSRITTIPEETERSQHSKEYSIANDESPSKVTANNRPSDAAAAAIGPDVCAVGQ